MTQNVQAAGAPHGGVVASVAYLNGRRARDVPIDDIAGYERPEHGLLWIGLHDPEPGLLRRVAEDLGACDKNQEEMVEPHRRAKIIDYGNMVLIVAITVEIESDRPVFGETQFLIGDGVLVTVRRGATATHSTLRERLEATPDLLKRGSDYVTSELLDLLVDRYVAAAARLESVVESAEQKLLIRGAKDADIRKLYRQRRDLLRIHTAIAPLAEICRRLARVEMSQVDEHARPYFGEVADRVLRVDELLNALREALAFAFEASQMIAQAQQNDTTRRLASWAAILAVPTAVAGIYGMNFEYMPELKAPWGYPVTLLAIGTVCSILYWRFRKSGWL
ncbi:putative magnesium and cobalt transport protein CorA [Bordetella bronchiseptica CA90 BB1334]|uniref:magnesium and cobalt transport protein CorA n=1 Tax=Bordetella TaxID=517 RepID=UPI000461DDF3|nr:MULTISPECIES: magnesium and cobalt transport protein CorA [Bordetella]ARP77432.1 magnesium transporter [Bordetella genomosp. 6]KDB72350.1 putative magnesium and cobalt transport protein CorA [Bordetella bronchiseptica CA90 BB1334]KDD42812.1 putative magnesium and cobalt transport protein CorA [Bordetella bronchiseptica OSU095]